MSGAARAGLAAALLYLSGALFAHRAVLADPWTLLPTPVRYAENEAPRFTAVYEADQGFVVGNVARVARAFAEGRWSEAGDTGFCAPMDRPHTLGEHMFGQGLLGALPWLVSEDPIFTYNSVAVLSTWISALAMYTLAFYWTRSFPAAFVAGLLFALHPNRLNNPAHLFLFANAWSALALLATHRLFDRGRWLDAGLLATLLCLQLLESLYPILALTVVGSVYGLWLAFTHADRLLGLAPKLVAIALVVGAFAWLVLGPYLEASTTWGILSGRKMMLLHPRRYLPGEAASPGWALLLLAAVGLLDRLRGARSKDDPRAPLLVAGFLLFWCSVWILPLPGLGDLPSPLEVLAPYAPFLEAVRALATLQFGVFLVLSVFAAYAVVALLEPLPRRMHAATATLLSLMVLFQTFHPRASVASFGTKADLLPIRGRPSDEALALLEKLPPGAVLDLPLDFEPIRKIRTMPGYLLAAGYHDRPVAACYNSFLTGLQDHVQHLARALPAPNAARALSALGFGSIRLHENRSRARRVEGLEPLLTDARWTEPLGAGDGVSLHRLRPQPHTTAFSTLADATPPPGFAVVHRPRDGVRFRFRRKEGDGWTFRHPHPIQPSPVRVRWRTADGRPAGESAGRTLLPPALAPGASMDRIVEIDVPSEPGAYVAELVRESEPDLVLASRKVTVR